MVEKTCRVPRCLSVKFSFDRTVNRTFDWTDSTRSLCSFRFNGAYQPASPTVFSYYFFRRLGILFPHHCICYTFQNGHNNTIRPVVCKKRIGLAGREKYGYGSRALSPRTQIPPTAGFGTPYIIRNVIANVFCTFCRIVCSHIVSADVANLIR